MLVAVNADKQPASSQSERETQLRRRLPADWDNVSVAAWAGLTVEFCRQHGDGVIIRGVRQGSDLRHEYQLAAMNEALGITTLLLPAKPRLAAVSSTVLRARHLTRWLARLSRRWANLRTDQLRFPVSTALVFARR